MSGLELAAGVIAVVTIAAQVASLAMDYGKSVQSAFVEMNKLLGEVNRLKHTAERVQSLLDGPEGHSLGASKPLREALDEAVPLLEATRERLVLPPHFGKWKRMLKRAGWSARSKGIDDAVVGLARCAQNITNALQVDQTHILAGLDRDQVFERLPHVGAAAYNSYVEGNEAFCLPGTRTELQHTILAWAKDPASSTLFWLHGIAGTGKSTVARTIARTLDSDGNLGASFFFKSGDGDRAKSSKVITTIVSQLAARDAELAALVRKTLASDPLLPDKSLQEQFEKLIFEPWTVLQDSRHHDQYHVIVLDALDECDDAPSIKVLVRLFALLSTLKSPRLFVFATSRAEHTVRLGFHGVQATYQDLVLHEIPETVVKADIAVFIETETKRIRNDYNGTTISALQLPENWPSRLDLETLVSMSVPLFIFAATACRFIGELMEGNPQEQLETFLSYKDAGGGSTLASTYTPVLDRLMRGVLDREKRIANFRMIVGTIILAGTPVSATLLHRLLDIDLATIWGMLNLLHSVLRVPDTKVEGCENLPIRLLHLSLRDFLINPLTIERHALGISEKETHRYIAQRCRITLSRKLTRNICQLPYPGSPREDIDDEQLQQHMTPDLMYACSYWMSHTAKGGVPGEICDEVLHFLQQFLLKWLEAMSFLGSTHDVADALHNLSQTLDNGQEGLLKFLEDTERFIQAHATQIHEAPLQVYSSALVFSPTSSIVRQWFKESEPKWLSQLPTAQEDWDSVVLTVPIYVHATNFALSSDAKMLVTYCMDGYIRRYNAQTGQFVAQLGQWSLSPSCFVLSRCATFLAVGYSKHPNVDKLEGVAGSLNILLLKTGELSHVFANAEVAAGCVDFAPNGLLLAYASDVGRVSLRSVVDGEETQSFRFPMVICHSIKFSSDSWYLAILGTLDVGSESAMTSISTKMVIAIWDVRNCTIVHVWEDVAAQVTRMITEGSIWPNSAKVILSDASPESACWYGREQSSLPNSEMYLARITENLPQVRPWFPEDDLKLSVTGTRTSKAPDCEPSFSNKGWAQRIEGPFLARLGLYGTRAVVLPEARLIGATTAHCDLKIYRLVRGITARKSAPHMVSRKSHVLTAIESDDCNLSILPAFARSPSTLVATLANNPSPGRRPHCTEVSEDLSLIIRGYDNGEISIFNPDGSHKTTFRAQEGQQCGVIAVGCSSDGTRLATMTTGNKIRVWHWNHISRPVLTNEAYHTTDIANSYTLRFSPDFGFLIIVEVFKLKDLIYHPVSAHVWELRDAAHPVPLRITGIKPCVSAKGAIFSPCSTQIAVLKGTQGYILLCDWRRPQLIAKLPSLGCSALLRWPSPGTIYTDHGPIDVPGTPKTIPKGLNVIKERGRPMLVTWNEHPILYLPPEYAHRRCCVSSEKGALVIWKDTDQVEVLRFDEKELDAEFSLLGARTRAA